MSTPFDTLLALDFETAWGRAVKLGFSCQTNEEYIRDPRFKAWGLTFKEVGTDQIPIWVRGDRIKRWAAAYDWSRTAVVAHNAQFDVTILSWLYDVHPAFIFDTLSMGRALHGVEAGNSLATLAERYELPGKLEGLSPSENILDALPFEVEEKLATYCKHDTWLCEQLFLIMSGWPMLTFPVKELRLIDMTVKMYTEAKLELDTEMLQKALDEEKTAREALLARLGIEEATLASNPQFAEVLRQVGVEPPMKTSKTTGEQTLALAKNDALFQAMLQSDNDELVLLCEARLKVKSTTERTRAQRFVDISSRGALPVPLSYYGAATGRWTASKKSAINMQNLKRGSFLRKAILAPKGYEIGVVDLSQIEPRVLAWLAEYNELLEIFGAGGDPYATFGAQMFSIPGMTKETHPIERQSAKSALLGAGYQLGWAAFAAQLLTGFLGAPPKRYSEAEAKQLGVTARDIRKFLDWDDNIVKLGEIPHTCTDTELLVHCLAAKAIIDRYRTTAEPVGSLWALLKELIPYSLYGGKEYVHKCLTFRKEEIVLPSGMAIHYPDLRPEKDAKGRVQWTFADGKKRASLYEGRVTNNITQGIARCVMTDGMLRTAKRYFVAGTVHDEELFLVPENEAEEGLAWAIEQMTKEPAYLPGIPLAAEGGHNKRYGLAKK